MTSAQLKKDGALLETTLLSGLEIRQLRAFVALVERNGSRRPPKRSAWHNRPCPKRFQRSTLR